MTESATTLTPHHNPAWDEQFAALKARHPNVRDAILVALHIVSQNPEIELADAKAQAALHGVRITAASVNAAHRLLGRDEAPEAATNPAAATPAKAPAPRRPRPVAAPQAVDAEALIRQVADKIQAAGSLEAERLRGSIRKAIELLQAAVG
jgi:hypothetical protein